MLIQIDAEKQTRCYKFIFGIQEGKPALWELDSDYYLHVSDLILDSSPTTDAEPPLTTVVAACKEGGFSRMKLTSFSKLIERTSGSIKNVRLFSEPAHKPGRKFWNGT